MFLRPVLSSGSEHAFTRQVLRYLILRGLTFDGLDVHVIADNVPNDAHLLPDELLELLFLSVQCIYNVPCMKLVKMGPRVRFSRRSICSFDKAYQDSVYAQRSREPITVLRK